jgi:hypothetical protein
MQATTATCPKGPALLAKAGVTLSDALWFYRQHRTGIVAADSARLAPILRKVNRFLARNPPPVHARLALA